MIIRTCLCGYLILHERFSREHLVPTSAFAYPVNKKNSKNSAVHSGKFFGWDGCRSIWMFACTIGFRGLLPFEIRGGAVSRGWYCCSDGEKQTAQTCVDKHSTGAKQKILHNEKIENGKKR